MIYVDDGSTDATGPRLEAILARPDPLRLLRHAQSGGQSAAVRSGVRAARAVDRRDARRRRPERPGLPAGLVAAVEQPAAHVGLAQGQRVGRKDTGFKSFQSRIANGVRAAS